MSTTSREEAPGSTPLESSGSAILELVEEQVALGPRVPGSDAHRSLGRLLAGRLREHGAEVSVQEFGV